MSIEKANKKIIHALELPLAPKERENLESVLDELREAEDRHAAELMKFNDICYEMRRKYEEEIGRLGEILREIDNWTKAYPLEAFPKPDLKRAARVLKENGMTLDAISADNMRHVLDGIREIIKKG